jgi:two-component system nitrogen regulation sensor histidine kinase GlnL
MNIAPTLHKRLLDSLNTAVLLLDRDLVVRFVNPAAEILLSLSASRLLGEPLPGCFLAAQDVREAMHAAVHSGHPFSKREAELHVTPFYQVTVDYTVSPLTEPGQPLQLLMELQQIDRFQRISREEALIASHNATRALVRGVAHEIKNPLGGIRGAAQLLERALPACTKDGDDLREYTRVIIDEADRLRSLADRMLGPRNLPQLRPVNVLETLERVRNIVRAEINDRIQIQRDYDPSIPDIDADQDQLIQVLLNIVRNAAQAITEDENRSTRGRILLRTRAMRQVTIGAVRHRVVCRIDIEDDGPGIPRELLDRIFYPMVSGRANGTGLGLSIAQSIINQHHGLIECDSVPGRTQFTLLLPFEQPAQPPVNGQHGNGHRAH